MQCAGLGIARGQLQAAVHRLLGGVDPPKTELQFGQARRGESEVRGLVNCLACGGSRPLEIGARLKSVGVGQELGPGLNTWPLGGKIGCSLWVFGGGDQLAQRGGE